MGGLFNRLQDEIDSRERQDGISPADLLDMPSALASIIKKIIRHNGMKLDEIAEELDQSPQDTRQMLDEMVEKGYVRRIEVKNEVWYKAHFARKRSRLTSDFWSNLDDVVDQEEE